ncbi:unnamed protein product [Clonostachys rosea f. rosea IK726]|uniref:Uncharacterized protein n=2 Tax=Bionectria ochroleuca TaxID=29856 RepID=A0A0B7KHT8_BIOOC|nr:unnamed protein product [Clonostachys rosea f. rosea IK726]
MASSIARTVIATGSSSGLGFEVIKQLLEQSQPYKVIVGARNLKRTQDAFDALKYDRAVHSLSILPLELNNLKTVKSFATESLTQVGSSKIDYLFLCAGISEGADKPGPHGSKWCEPFIVNHLSQHYLVHLLHEKLVESKSRLVFVSSGAVRNVPDVSVLDKQLLGASGAPRSSTYPQTKFVGLLGAHWWRRQLTGQCHVVAVSPGLIPATNLAAGLGLSVNMADAKTVPEGAKSLLEAFTRTDFPSDPEQIFLTSWGEWWSKDVYAGSLDKELQDKWCPSKEQIEKEENISN